MEYKGKFLDFTYQDKVKKYSDVQLDMLFFVLDTTKINRFSSEESFRELLIRFFLIRDKNFDENALDVINEELLFDGFIGDRYFSIKIGDLINLIGYSSSTSKYHIQGSLMEFIERYIYKLPNVKVEPREDKPEIIDLNPTALGYIVSNVLSLLEIENCTLKFKSDLKEIEDFEIEKAIKLADYVMNQLDPRLFLQFNEDIPALNQMSAERYLYSNEVNFDIYEDLDQENLIKIYEFLLDEEDVKQFKLNGATEAFKKEFKFENAAIVFAYGVKHNYIKLSSDYQSKILGIDPIFQVDFDLLIEMEEFTDGSTQDIFDFYKMENWIHLLP